MFKRSAFEFTERRRLDRYDTGLLLYGGLTLPYVSEDRNCAVYEVRVQPP